MEEEVITTKVKIQVKIVEPEVGIEPLVVVQVEITKTIKEERNVYNVVEYIYFIFCHVPKILG